MFQSRLPKIAAEISPAMDAVARRTAEQVAERAKARVPVQTGRLRDAIHVEHEGPGVYAVVAGDGDVFYGHIVEHGGAHIGPRPFLVPAAEETRGEIVKAAAVALKAVT